MVITIGPDTGCWQCVIWYRVGKEKCLRCGGTFKNWESWDSATQEKIAPGQALLRMTAPRSAFQKKPRPAGQGPTNIRRGEEWMHK